MKLQATLVTTLLLTNTVSIADPTVSGETISWPDNGWYQVLNEADYTEICAGASACTVAPGSYLVINHTTGERFSKTVVLASSNSISVVDSTISWPDDGWYQVQNAETFESVCEGGQSCEVPDGIYVVINHTTGTRSEAIGVQTSVADPIAVDVRSNIIYLNDGGWIEVQRQSDNLSVCQGQDSCAVPSTDVYTAINHTTGERYSDIEVLVSVDVEPTIALALEGSPHTWTEAGQYQVQRSDNFNVVCEGVSSCEVSPGSYIVINLTTDTRYEDVIVNADSSDNLFFDPEATDSLNLFFQNLSSVLRGDLFEDFLNSGATIPQRADTNLTPNSTAYYDRYGALRLPDPIFTASACHTFGRVDHAEVDTFRYTFRALSANQCSEDLLTYNGSFSTYIQKQNSQYLQKPFRSISFEFEPVLSIEDLNGTRRMAGSRNLTDFGNALYWTIQSFSSDFQENTVIEDLRLEMEHNVQSDGTEGSRTFSTRFQLSADWSDGLELQVATSELFRDVVAEGGFETGQMTITSEDGSRISIDANTGNLDTFFVDFWPYAQPNRLELTWGDNFSMPCLYSARSTLGPSDEAVNSSGCINTYYLRGF
jgi:hypothetical protein